MLNSSLHPLKPLSKNFVSIHSKGLSNQENVDFFKHCYRMFLVNSGILTRNMAKAQKLEEGLSKPSNPQTSFAQELTHM
jgi:hypothetical protein